MPDSTLLNRATLIIDQVTAEKPADYVLRGELGAAKYLDPEEKRDISHAVFAYYRWFGWLDTKASTQARVAAALDLQRKFDTDPSSFKPETLAARAVPAWIASEIDLSPAHASGKERARAALVPEGTRLGVHRADLAGCHRDRRSCLLAGRLRNANQNLI